MIKKEEEKKNNKKPSRLGLIESIAVHERYGKMYPESSTGLCCILHAKMSLMELTFQLSDIFTDFERKSLP